MAVYTNDLRLKEIANGDESGTWGTSTNLNLKLIGESLSFQTEAVFDADGDKTTTVADGQEDPARGLFYKATSTTNLTATRVLTIGPATISRVMFIENATSGSQSITVRQSAGGTNVTIANGQTKAVYLDGAASNPNVVDAFQDLSIPDLFIDDDLTFTSDSAVITFGADGDTTLTHTDGSGLTLNSTNKIMFNDASQFIQGSSATVLSLGATDEIDLTATAIDVNGTMDVSGAITSSAGMTITEANNTTSHVAARFNSSNRKVGFQVNNSNGQGYIGSNINSVSGSGNSTYDIANKAAKIDFADGIEFFTAANGSAAATVSFTNNLEIDTTASVFNEGSADVDFRVESNGNANALFVDGGNDKIGVLTNAPSGQFHVYNGMLQVGSKTGDTSVQQNTNAIRIAAVPDSSTEWGGLQWYREFSDVIGCEIIAARASSTETDSDLIFKTSTNSSNAVEAMRIDHSGLVGIGNSSPSSFNALADNLVVGTTSGSNGISIVAATDGNSSIYFADGTSGSGQQLPGFIQYGHSSNALLLGAATIEHIKLDGSVVINEGSEDLDVRIEGNNNSSLLVVDAGNDVVVVGSSVAENRLSQPFAVTSAGARGGMVINSFHNSDSGPIVDFQVSRNTTAGSHTVVQDGDALGTFIFRGDDGDEFRDSVAIEANVDGSPGNNDMPGMLRILTASDFGGSLTERMRVTAAGPVGIGKEYVAAGVGSAPHGSLLVGNTATNDYAMSIHNIANAANAYGMQMTAGANDGSGTTFYIYAMDGDRTGVGQIANINGTFALADLSDETLKENIKDTEIAGIDRIKALKVRQFDWKKSGDTNIAGFVAQELEAVMPEVVITAPDDLHDEDQRGIKSISRDMMVPTLVKALQEAIAKIETLETKVAALEGGG